ncbi:4Fe-4S ferredoxin [Halostella sp. JP-L12]|uniref:ferredoxin family protein n=1 Tax=Halostella TaxID=1843185 RepID=UPI000EF7E2D0|nr:MULTISPECIES: 4Fe-4S dicluster domain-containing protein [Halostella]NHN49186.1 4Fe-4S ferredoxin [Halostella sp. JP-L12]
MSTHPKTPDVDNATLEDRLYTVKYEDPGDSHLDVKVPGFCAERCDTDDCVDVCPADVWRKEEGDDVPTIAYENCLECGSCRFACPYNNVEWEYPENGSGVTYRYG